MGEDLQSVRAAAQERLKTKDFQGVIDLIDPALAEAEPDASLLMLRGVAKMQLGNLQDGVNDLRSATAEKPDDPQLQFNLGNGFAMLQKPEAAVRAYTVALQADPGYAPARKALQKLDPAALERLDAKAAQSPAAAGPAEKAPVVLGLDGEPMPNAPTAAADTVAYEPPPSVVGRRESSRPSVEPGAVRFVRTWFWIAWVIGLLGGLGWIGLLNAQSNVVGALSGDPSAVMQEAMKGLPPELQQEYQQSQAQMDEALKGLGSDQTAQQIMKATQTGVRMTMILIGVSLLINTLFTWLIARGVGTGAGWGWWLAMIFSFLGLFACPLTIGYIFAIINLVKPEAKEWCGLA